MQLCLGRKQVPLYPGSQEGGQKENEKGKGVNKTAIKRKIISQKNKYIKANNKPRAQSYK
jgi:hypothetical protein